MHRFSIANGEAARVSTMGEAVEMVDRRKVRRAIKRFMFGKG